MMIKRTFIPICSCFFLLAGCLPTKTIEDVQIIESIGYDTAEDEKYQLTLAVVMFSPSEGGTIKNETISAANFTGYGAVWNAQRELPKPTAGGKMMVALFGEDLAKNGINEILDGLKRHTTIGRMVDFCVVEGDAKELLEGQYSMSQTISRYLKELLRHSKKGNLPSTNFHEFMYSYYSQGQDSFMPLIQKKGDKIQLSGLALFHEDKYVDKILADKMFIFKMLYENVDMGTYQASFPEKDSHVALETVESKVDYTINQAMTRPEIQINVEIKGVINEVTSNIELKTKLEEQNFEKLIAHNLKENSLQMIKQFREKGIDPLGIADRARSQTRGWKLSKWQELYPDAPVKLKIKVDILQTGITN